MTYVYSESMSIGTWTFIMVQTFLFLFFRCSEKQRITGFNNFMKMGFINKYTCNEIAAIAFNANGKQYSKMQEAIMTYYIKK